MRRHCRAVTVGVPVDGAEWTSRRFPVANRRGTHTERSGEPPHATPDVHERTARPTHEKEMESAMTDTQPGLDMEELEAESGKALPSKEVMSLIDLNVDLNAALDLVAPIDLAVAANANVAAPIEASVGANILSYGSHSASAASQGTSIEQLLDGDAQATAPQD